MLKRLDESFSKEVFHKAVTGESPFEVDYKEINITPSGQLSVGAPKKSYVWIVEESNGAYEDATDTILGVFTSEKKAREMTAARLQEINKLVNPKSPSYSEYANYEFNWVIMRRVCLNTIDPGYEHVYLMERPYYAGD